MAAEVGNNAADVGQLLPMLKAVRDNTGQAPEHLLADAGYRSEKNLQDLAGSGVDAVVALGREGKRCSEFKLVCLALNLRRMGSMKAA